MSDDNSFSKLFLEDKNTDSKPKLRIVENKAEKIESNFNELINDVDLDHKTKLENLNRLLEMSMDITTKAIELADELGDSKVYESTQNIIKKTHDMNLAYMKQIKPVVSKSELTVNKQDQPTVDDGRVSTKDLL